MASTDSDLGSQQSAYEAGVFCIHVKSTAGVSAFRPFDVSVHAKTTVEELKHMVFLRVGVPLATQQLLFGLEYLEDDRVLSSVPWSETNHLLNN
jgi:hypothetical protein